MEMSGVQHDPVDLRPRKESGTPIWRGRYVAPRPGLHALDNK
jgi:hypothetical protein